MAQRLFIAFAAHGRSNMLGDEGENFFFSFAEAFFLRIALQGEDPEDVVPGLEGHAQPVYGGSTYLLHFAPASQLTFLRNGIQIGLARAHDIFR